MWYDIQTLVYQYEYVSVSVLLKLTHISINNMYISYMYAIPKGQYNEILD